MLLYYNKPLPIIVIAFVPINIVSIVHCLMKHDKKLYDKSERYSDPYLQHGFFSNAQQLNVGGGGGGGGGAVAPLLKCKVK